MKRIVLDFLRRRWWVVAVFALVSFGSAALGSPIMLAPFAMILLIHDVQRGVLLAVRPLPVSGRTQAGTWWTIGVWLVPALMIVPLLAGDWVYATTAPGSRSPLREYDPWFASAAQWWVGLGYGALCFFLGMLLPTRTTVGAAENASAALLGIFWGFSIPALPFLAARLPHSVGAIQPWHWAAFVAVPICVVLSFRAAPGLIQRRLVSAGTSPKPAPSAPLAGKGEGFTGVPLYLFIFVGRMVLLLAFMVLCQVFFLWWFSGKSGSAANASIAGQTAVFGIVLGSFTVEVIGLRALRTMPLSTSQLAALLLAVPGAVAIFAAAVTAFWMGNGDPGVPVVFNFLAQVLAIFGCGAMSLAVLLHFVSGFRFVAPMALATLPAFGFFDWAKHPLPFGTAGALLALAGFALLHRGLRRSVTFYLPRRTFGMAMGQPAIGR